MTICWYAQEKELAATPCLYRQQGELSWKRGKVKTTILPLFHLSTHHAFLSHLEPDTYYEFQIGEEGTIHTFRTLPDTLSRPIRLAIGGDIYSLMPLFEQMNETIAKKDPDFAVLGGDIAYAIGWYVSSPWERWEKFFEKWFEQMRASDGRLIPLLAVVGNHDATKKRSDASSLLFYTLFPFPKQGICYRSFDVGNYLTLILLDSAHTTPIEGKQTAWLETTLENRKETLYKMAIYHVGAYPAVYPFYGKVPSSIRTHWVPLFEQYGVTAAFEHHNHAYKRTYPLKNGRMDPRGVIYFGDGCWGVPTRSVRSSHNWYLAKAQSIHAFWLVTLDTEERQIASFDHKGHPIEGICW